MGDTITMKRAIKFAQKYMEKAELPLTAADLTHAFFAGKDFGLEVLKRTKPTGIFELK